MSEGITAIVAALLTYAAQVIRQRIKERRKTGSTMPPPPNAEQCKECFFFREFRKRSDLTRSNSDTQIIRIYRERTHERESNGKSRDLE